ncbi:dTDP-4-dehydrorhamnose reductase [Marmoricola sp. Leaf446]|uniref:sugar nucleotide-binding protein n=1 Tax=Marmoricola sp. Leaf446 TaxID=1736379 RepID=UPI0006F7A011|nr:bifunctional dTDP-4-dehydrorhamnose 3,5-epimerase family protein/NAD(P)-dependent oxidoreductase [Marmoricola sp. Leaf446]KQT92245.1 dTDP-4-dehydrorhamnose reductase [Marmoricola sp. Leaf446]
MTDGPAELGVDTSDIPGLLVLRLPVHGDNRGWFKESWQRAKMTALGLPDFGPVQHNVSFNDATGVTRGIHAEPWDKLVSVATGRVFGAWVDLREGESFGRVVTVELGPDTAVFVPRGVGNAYQTLEPATAYSYLVNAHWSAAARASYTFLNVADETAAVPWPIPLDRAELSQADLAHPRLAEVRPFPARRSVVLGAGGQVGRALAALLPDAVALTRTDLDLTGDLDEAYDWDTVDVVYNAAAHTGVDAAETPEGRPEAWATNVAAVGRLVEVCRRHRLPLVHFSTDYVYDGTRELHQEDEPVAPLGVYGQTKAAGDALVATLPRHHVLRTSWVIGDGGNFLATMARLADNGVSPTVVADQVGRLGFADDLARAAHHLATSGAEPGVYHVTCSGDPVSWADLARAVFVARGREADAVTPVTTEEYAAGKQLAPRPRHSTMDLTKLEATGFVPSDGAAALAAYLRTLPPPAR